MLKKLITALLSITLSITTVTATSSAVASVKQFKQSGMASWYGRQFHGRQTANGERFNMHAMTAAHRTLPLNCVIRVTNKTNGKSVVLRVNDRGPFSGNRVLDVSYGASKALGFTDNGLTNVKIEVLEVPGKGKK